MRPPVYSLRRMTNSGRYPAPGSPASPRAPDKAAAPSEALRLPLQALPSARGRTWAAVGRRESGCKWGAGPRSGLGHRARASSPTDLLRPRWQEPNERCRVHQTPAMRTGSRPGRGASAVSAMPRSGSRGPRPGTFLQLGMAIVLVSTINGHLRLRRPL